MPKAEPVSTMLKFNPLAAGDEIRVLALSRSLGGAMQQGGFTEQDVAFATGQLEAMGLNVSFGQHVWECNEHLTASPQHRLEDLHEALVAGSVKAILAVSGGMGATQILEGIDYHEIKSHPKIICGWSDIGHLCNAILARAGLTTYYGPNFTSFMMRQGAEYLLRSVKSCLFGNAPVELQPSSRWSDDAWHKDQARRTFYEGEGFWAIQEGEAEGRAIGGSCCCLNMLQGTRYFPPLRQAILFLEQPAHGKATLMELDGGLRALSFQREFPQVRALVIGRFAKSGGVTRENLAALLGEIPALWKLPILANVDFGHTMPIATLPIGARCQLRVSKPKPSITFTVW